MTAAVGIAQSGINNVSWRNRIINGDMRIDQRNAGASKAFSTAWTYYLDRWQGRLMSGAGSPTIAQSTTAPTGFTNSLLVTNGTGATPAAGDTNTLVQAIEGYNVADLGWGTSNAQAIALSFVVRSSVTGTFSGALSNANSTRSYPFTFTINSANTFETKAVTIAGDTSGTWNTTNGTGVQVFFDLGTGSTYQGTAGAWAGADYRAATGATKLISTTGATFYITGVQLEAGTVATPFERLDYGRQLIQCQRYCQKIYATQFVGAATVRTGGTGGYLTLAPKVDMRAGPTITTTGTPVIYVGDSNGAISSLSPGDGISSLLNGYNSTATGVLGQSGLLYTGTGGSVTFSAEL